MAERTDLTIQDVAHEADVSIATVSRVLNRSSNVASETRDHVLDVIEDLDFVPSSAAKRLANTESRRKDSESGARNPERRAPLALTFEGAWTDRERRNVVDAIAQCEGDGPWVEFKAQIGSELLFAVIKLQGADLAICTGETLQELIEQFSRTPDKSRNSLRSMGAE